ncbi:unnamed protein product [Cylicostephanus goldi]|uniref:Uncharacterized protein n=1 Tax=Cylicostephanus goldi TaxID=71465 RepID=A0A3P6S7A7_CYLGO|nr:unnamed protein product [Cylicostephanus goldi]
MGFGERKAYFLAIRPNPRYATWFGKKKNWQNKSEVKKDKKFLEKSTAQNCDDTPRSQVFCVPVAKEDRTILEEDDENIIEKKGNHALNPLVNGIPFWIIPEEEEELNEEDLPIDRDLIEKAAMLKPWSFIK